MTGVRTVTLTDFLLARIAEDEAVAAAAAVVAPEPWEVADRGWLARLYRDGSDVPMVEVEQGTLNSPNPGDLLRCFERFSPVRASAECEAKRRIVGLCRSAYRAYPATDKDGYFEEILEQLAAPYADHPDYRDEWKP